jgi:hypothetical protein
MDMSCTNRAGIRDQRNAWPKIVVAVKSGRLEIQMNKFTQVRQHLP